MREISYQIESAKSFEEIARLLEKAAPEHGFRVLAVHDTQATLAEKGFKIDPLKIYEVCNSGFAYKALNKDINVSLFMPCKIVIRPESGKTIISLARPTMIAAMLPDSGLEELSLEMEKQLIEIIESI
jgi:uncharacterized protein (DUF302 family)